MSFFFLFHVPCSTAVWTLRECLIQRHSTTIKATKELAGRRNTKLLSTESEKKIGTMEARGIEMNDRQITPRKGFAYFMDDLDSSSILSQN